MDANHIPYGPEWEKEMDKLSKKELIGMVRVQSEMIKDLIKMLGSLIDLAEDGYLYRNNSDAPHDTRVKDRVVIAAAKRYLERLKK